MFVAFVAKTIFKSKNGVVTPFKSATNLRQTSDEACRKNFFERTLLRALGRLHKKKVNVIFCKSRSLIVNFYLVCETKVVVKNTTLRDSFSFKSLEKFFFERKASNQQS